MIKKCFSLWLIAGMSVLASSVNTPFSHGPIGLMGDHSHKKGEWMFSYRNMSMEMSGLRSEKFKLSNNEIFNNNLNESGGNYMNAPQDMIMNMHMFGMMYGLSNHTTLMVMLPYLKNSMTLKYRAPSGGEFNSQSEGLGDIKITALHLLKHTEHGNLHLINGLSIPTGEIEETGVLPNDSSVRLPYTMQLGTGSLGYILGVNWLEHRKNKSWGTQIKSTFTTEDNENDYRVGNKYEFNTWFSESINSETSYSLRLNLQSQENITGHDELIENLRNDNPLARTDKGMTTINIGIGLNFLWSHGLLKGQRSAVELVIPIYQDVNGIQMNNESILTIGWQYAIN